MPQIEFYDSDGATLIADKDWGRVIAGAAGTAKKFAYKNIDNRTWAQIVMGLAAVGDSDGIDIARWALDTATLYPPINVASVAASGGSFAAGTFYHSVTAFNATGETIASAEVSSSPASGDKVTVSWDAVAGADGYRLYRTATPGVYGASSKVGSDITPGSTLSAVDDGSATGTGTVPAANTTGGAAPNYGTPPTLGTADALFGDVKQKQMVFFWEKNVTTVGMANAGNPRLWDLAITETG